MSDSLSHPLILGGLIWHYTESVVVSGLVKAITGYIPGNRQPSFSNTQVWTTVHCGTGIICACLPICWPLFARLGRVQLPKWLGVSLFQRYWCVRGGESTSEKPRTPSADSERGFELSNNFTSGEPRGFHDGSVEEPISHEDYLLSTSNPRLKSFMYAA